MRIILLALFVHINSVANLNENLNSGQSDVPGRHYFNHPPWAEDYNPIPVSVVYENDLITGKIIKPEVEENSQKPVSNIEEVTLATETYEEEITTESIYTSAPFQKNVTESKQDDIPVRPKARALSDFQIPVAVIYDDTTPGNIQNLQRVNASKINNSRRRYKQIRRRKHQDKTSITNEKPIVQNTELPKSQIEMVDYIKLHTKNIDSPRPQPRKIEFVKPQSEPKSFQTIDETNTKSIPRKRVRDPVVPILSSENYVFSHSGNFHYSYEGGDGTKAYSEGQLIKSVNDESTGEGVSGGFSYTDKEGNDFSITYTADERGYRPIGAHLPTSPPIPPEIARALAYLATATTPEPVTKPSSRLTTRV